MTTLECSSKGDRRFSAFYAKVDLNGKYDSIENHYQLSKRFIVEGKEVIPTNWKEAKGKVPMYFVVNGNKIPLLYISSFYDLLWVKYLDQHPELVEFAKQFDEFTDMFRGKSQVCQADSIRTYVKEGRSALMRKAKPFIKILNQGGMVVEKVGDLLKSKENILAHQVNGLGIMGGGLALQIRKTYPEIFDVYLRLCNEHHLSESSLGLCQIVPTKSSDVYIANLFGQYEISTKSQQTNYQALQKALISLKEEARSKNLSIGLPYELGSGLGGGDWQTVKQIIYDVFQDYPATIYRLPGA